MAFASYQFALVVSYWRRVLRRAVKDTVRFLLSERLGSVLTALSIPIGSLIDWRVRGLSAMFEEMWISFAYWLVPLGLLTFCAFIWHFLTAPSRMERDIAFEAANERIRLLAENSELRRRLDEMPKSLELSIRDLMHLNIIPDPRGRRHVYELRRVNVKNNLQHVIHNVKVVLIDIENTPPFIPVPLLVSNTSSETFSLNPGEERFVDVVDLDSDKDGNDILVFCTASKLIRPEGWYKVRLGIYGDSVRDAVYDFRVGLSKPLPPHLGIDRTLVSNRLFLGFWTQGK